MTANCPACGSRNLRPSQLQRKDLVYLLTLRAPVRCRYCRERFYVSIFSILKVRHDAAARDARYKNKVRTPESVHSDQHSHDDQR